jgi:ferrochelatase
MEVLYDLDTEAAELCHELAMKMVRAATVGTHPDFIRMIRQLIQERVEPGTPRLVLGSSDPCPDVCQADCCPAPAARRP